MSSETQFIKCIPPRFRCYVYSPLNKASVPCFSYISAEQRCSKTVRFLCSAAESEAAEILSGSMVSFDL